MQRPNLFTVEIRNRIRRTLRGGVYSILDYAFVEFTVTGINELHCTTVG